MINGLMLDGSLLKILNYKEKKVPFNTSIQPLEAHNRSHDLSRLSGHLYLFEWYSTCQGMYLGMDTSKTCVIMDWICAA